MGRNDYHIKKEGRFHWNVPIREATLYDLVQTFLMNIGNNVTIEFAEVQNWGSFEKDISKLNMAFYSYLKQSIKGWRPNAHLIKAKELVKYIKSTGVYPAFVLEAIWIRSFYSVSEFASLFGVKNKQAEKILEAAGYQRKNHNLYYYLIPQRKDKLICDLYLRGQSVIGIIRELGKWKILSPIGKEKGVRERLM